MLVKVVKHDLRIRFERYTNNNAKNSTNSLPSCGKNNDNNDIIQ